MKNSPEPRKKQKVAVMLWYNQGDAAAKVDEDRGRDGGGSGMQDGLASSFLVCYRLRTWGKMMRACRQDERSGER